MPESQHDDNAAAGNDVGVSAAAPGSSAATPSKSLSPPDQPPALSAPNDTNNENANNIDNVNGTKPLLPADSLGNNMPFATAQQHSLNNNNNGHSSNANINGISNGQNIGHLQYSNAASFGQTSFDGGQAAMMAGLQSTQAMNNNGSVMIMSIPATRYDTMTSCVDMPYCNSSGNSSTYHHPYGYVDKSGGPQQHQYHQSYPVASGNAGSAMNYWPHAANMQASGYHHSHTSSAFAKSANAASMSLPMAAVIRVGHGSNGSHVYSDSTTPMMMMMMAPGGSGDSSAMHARHLPQLSNGSGPAAASGANGPTEHPFLTLCPFCRTVVTTSTRPIRGLITYLSCIGMSLLVVLIPCAIASCWMKRFQDVQHFCPKCSNSIAIYKRL